MPRRVVTSLTTGSPMSIRTVSPIAMLTACLFACASGRAGSASVPQSPENLQQLALDVVHSGMSQEQYSSVMRALANALVETMEKQAMAENRKLPPDARKFLAEIMGQ